PILVGLILSGISIYWRSPIYQHKPDPVTGNFDVTADIGIWICAHVPWLHHYNSPPDWVYNHLSLGPGMLAPALRLHWLCAYAFMLNGAVYVVGLISGGGWRGLLPRRPIWLMRSRCPGSSLVFPSGNFPPLNGPLPVSTQSTTR